LGVKYVAVGGDCDVFAELKEDAALAAVSLVRAGGYEDRL
jgi:hypothetical protein